jgi:hypothetical protein
MSKKQLLSEGEIRRFMKFAKLEPLAESFISEAGYDGPMDEGYLDEEEDAEMPEDDMGDMDDMGDEAELEMGDEEAPAPAGDAEAVVADALAKLAAELKDKLGVDISVDASAGEGEEMEDMGDEGEEMEMDVEEPPADEAGGEEMVAEVTRRVMARITESRRRADRANAIDEVTNRIMKRILRSK